MEPNHLLEAFLEELRNFRSSQEQLAANLTRATEPEFTTRLRDVVHERQVEIARQLQRCESIFDRFEASPAGVTSHGMQGILRDLKQTLSLNNGPETVWTEPALLADLRKIGHYQIACLRSLIALANSLKCQETETHLGHCLDEEIEADRSLETLSLELLEAASMEKIPDPRPAGALQLA